MQAFARASLVLPMAIAAGLVACAPEPERPDTASIPATLEGCYDLRVGEFVPTVPGAESLYVATPPRIEITSTALDSSYGATRYALRVAPGALPSIHGRSWWELAEPDSIRLYWMSMSGVQVTLARSGGTMSGTARARWDYREDAERAAVEARPVACDAPLAEGDRLRYRFPRGVALAGGDSLRLGDPLPDGWASGGGSDEVVGSPRLRPPYSDVDRVRLFASAEGGIHQIRLRLPASVTYEELQTRLIDALGPPTTDLDERIDRGDWAGKRILHTSWRDRLVSIHFPGSDEERPDPIVVIISGR